MLTRRDGAQALLKRAAHQPDDAAGLAVKAAPKGQHLVALGVSARQAQSALDRLGPAGIKLHATETRVGRVFDDAPEQRGTCRRGKAATA